MLLWDDAISLAQNWTGDTSATMLVNLKRLLNLGYKEILHTFNGEETEDVRTSYTQASTRAVKLPPNYVRIHSVTATVGNQIYTLVEEESQDLWADRLFTNRTSTRPEVYFIRPRFGVGGSEILLDPIPTDANTIITINYAAKGRDLSVDKYTTGTITATNGSTTITGSGTTFTVQMVGRYFQVNDDTGDGMWYRITGFTSTTVLTIENKYDGATVSGKALVIAEAFNLPEDLQLAPVYYTLWHYFLGYRKDLNEARLSKWKGEYQQKTQLAEKTYKRKGKSNVLQDKGKATGWPSLPSNWPENVG